MNYEYYYDGNNFYIILNRMEMGDGVIVVWNGKWGEEYAVEEFGYFVQPDGETLEKIAW